MSTFETKAIENAALTLDVDQISAGVLACMQAPECTDAGSDNGGLT